MLASRIRSEMNASGSALTLLALPGDTVGASPRNTSLLLDEPTILFFNEFGNADCTAGSTATDSRCNVIAVPGNHEFNRGTGEMLRMVRGGNGNTAIPRVADPYPGLGADSVCANVVWKENDTPVLPPYVIHYAGGVPVAFIGAVTTETTILELPGNIEDVRFINESEAINRYVAELQGPGIHSFVILLHNGGNQDDEYAGPTRQGCNVTGPIVPVVALLDEDVDVVLSAHSHDFTNAYLKNAGGKEVLVTQAYAYGVAYADVDLLIDPETGDIAGKSAAIVPVYADDPAGGGPDPVTGVLIDKVADAVKRMEGDVVAIAASGITREERTAGGSALGELVADSQRDAMDADVAFVAEGSSAGSIHAGIAPGNVTWYDLEAVLPADAAMARDYGEWYSRPHVALRELTGSQIRTILERPWEDPLPQENLSVSGLTYTCDPSRPAGERVTEIRINGSPLDPDRTYSAAMNYYMAYGMGEYAPAWSPGTNVTVGPADIDALVEYIRSGPEKWT